MHHPSHSSRFYHPNNIGWAVQNITVPHVWTLMAKKVILSLPTPWRHVRVRTAPLILQPYTRWKLVVSFTVRLIHPQYLSADWVGKRADLHEARLLGRPARNLFCILTALSQLLSVRSAVLQTSFLKRFIAQKISEIHRVTKLRNCSFNQFALVVPRRASDRECTVLGTYEYSSEKQVQRKNTAAVG